MGKGELAGYIEKARDDVVDGRIRGEKGGRDGTSTTQNGNLGFGEWDWSRLSWVWRRDIEMLRWLAFLSWVPR